jgi:hypothetical protein
LAPVLPGKSTTRWVTTDHDDQRRGRGVRREKTAGLRAIEDGLCGSAFIVVVRCTDSAWTQNSCTFRNGVALFIVRFSRSHDDQEHEILHLSNWRAMVDHRSRRSTRRPQSPQRGDARRGASGIRVIEDRLCVLCGFCVDRRRPCTHPTRTAIIEAVGAPPWPARSDRSAQAGDHVSRRWGHNGAQGRVTLPERPHPAIARQGSPGRSRVRIGRRRSGHRVFSAGERDSPEVGACGWQPAHRVAEWGARHTR